MMIVIYAAFFLLTFPFAIHRNRLFGMYYFTLFIYSVFAIFGYLYIPGLSESLGAYFGDDVGLAALVFTFGSLAGFWAVNMIVYRPAPEKRVLVQVTHNNAVTPMGIGTLALITAVFSILLTINFTKLSWYTAQDAEHLTLSTSIFIGFYKIIVGFLVICYVIVRSPEIRNDRLFLSLYIFLLAAFAIASIRLGNRTDPAALVAGMMLFELLTGRISLRRFALFGAWTLAAIFAISMIEYFRYTTDVVNKPLLERIVENDYYAPAHMLFAEIAFKFTDPALVMRSNSANALFLLNQPYLQQPVTDLFRPGIATRSAGYAFYIFAEGWLFSGWWGIVYNAAIPSAGLWLWNRISCTNSRIVNLLPQVLAGAMLIAMARQQSSYFIKLVYTFFIPNLVLVSMLLNVKVLRVANIIEKRL